MLPVKMLAARLGRNQGRLLNMIRVSKAHGRKGIARDRVGKVYLIVSINGVMLRKCLVCEEMFPREVCAEHSQAVCGPRI